jgi:hypothetical protein
MHGRGKVLMGKPEGNKPLGRPRCRWENLIRMDLRETNWGVEWIQMAQSRDRWRSLVDTAMTFVFWSHGVSG